MVRLGTLLLIAFTFTADAQSDPLVKARPDFQNQLYLAAPTNAPGTSLAQPASVAFFSGNSGDATNAATPHDGQIRLTQSIIGASFAAPPASLAPPVILTQPSDVFVGIGSNAALTVLVSSDSPVSYQWFRNGTLLAGATNSTLIFNNPQFTNSGSFFVTISNASGSITSQVANFADATKLWTGGGDGQSWNDAANWNGSTLPTASDSIFIGSGGAGITNVPALTLKNLICQRALSLNNSLTVTGAVDATSSLYLAPGISLTVSGANAMFVGEGSTIANQVSFYAQQGGLISLLGLTNYINRADANNTLHASGLGSVLDLPALQTVTGPVAQVSYLTIQALQGGLVKLTNVRTMTVNYVYGGASSIGEHGIRIFADGTNSVVDLSGLLRFAGDGVANYSSIQPSSGGQIWLDKLHSATAVSLIVSNGMTLRLSALTNYDGGAASSCSLRASGAGSLLDLPALQTVTGPVAQVSYLTIQALQGGVVKLTNVQTMTVNYVYGGASSIAEHGIRILADGTNSVLDLSGLLRFAGDGSANYSSIQPSSGGQIWLDKLHSATAVSLIVSNGMTLRLSALTNYDGARSSCFLEAAGAGSLLDLPALRTVTGPVSQANYLTIRAVAGGMVKMTNVQTMKVNYVFDGVSALHDHGIRVLADGNNSLVNLIGLTQFTEGDHANEISSIVQTNAGLVLLRTNLVISSGAILALAPTILTQPQGASLFASSNVMFLVQVSASTPLSYQWFFNHTTPLAGATNALLSFPSVGYDGIGSYRVIVANAFGSATSAVATLQVAQPLTVAVQGRGTVAKLPDTPGYSFGQAVLLTATAGRYYNFTGWSDGNTNNPRSVTISTSNNYYAAIFANAPGVVLEELVFPQWEKIFGGSGDDRCQVVRRTSDGGYILGGFSTSGNSGTKTNTPAGASGLDCWVIKTDREGNELWQYAFGGTGAESVADILLTSDGGYLLICASSSGVSGNKTNGVFGSEDIWLIKLNANGQKLFERGFGTPGGDAPGSAAPTPDGGFVVAGVSDWPPVSPPGGTKTAPHRGLRDMWLLKLDGAANLVQDWTHGSSENDSANAVLATRDGGYFLAGGFSLTRQNRQLWTVKVDATGATQWNPTFGTGTDESFPNVALAARQTFDNGFAVLGVTPATSGNGKTADVHGEFDWWLIRLDANGSKIWDKSFGGSNRDFLEASAGSLQITDDGGFVLAGYSASAFSGNKATTNHGGFDGWMVKTDAGGNKQWELNLGGSDADSFSSVEVLPDGYLLAGYTQSTNGSGTRTTPGQGGQDFWLVKLFAREAPVGTPVILVSGQFANDRTNVFHTQVPVSVVLTSSWNGPVHFTTDGSEPDFNSPPYDSQNPPQVIPPATVKVIAYLDDNYFASDLYVDYSEVVSTRLEHVPLYTLNVSTPGGGVVATAPVGAVFWSNSVVTISATNLPGWTFLGWQGDVTGTNPVVSVTMNSNVSALAVFGTALTTNATTGGSIARTPVLALYPFGSAVRLTALPAASRYLSFWTGRLSGALSPQELVITNANPVVGASFGNLTGTNFGLAVLITGEGTVSYALGTNTFATNRFGSNFVVTLTATPKPGWYFTNWTGGSNSTINPLQLVMHTNKVITANFAPGILPMIVAQPTNQVATVGAAVTLSVVATGTAPLSYQWRWNGTNVASEQLLFADDFESYPAGSNLNGQGGWVPEPLLPSSIVVVSNSSALSSKAINGRARAELSREHGAQHPVTLDATGINSMRFTALAFTNDGISHNQAIYLLSDTNLSQAVAVWTVVSTPVPHWRFNATGSGGTASVTDGFGHPVRMEIVVDAVANEIYGVSDFGAGPVETERFSMPRSNLLTFNAVNIYVDHRGYVPGNNRGMEVDNITLSRRTAGQHFNPRATGGHSSQLLLNNYQPADAGNYSVVVSSPFGSVTSLVAAITTSLTSNQPPVVALTNPAPGAIFTAPASFVLQASATDDDGAVTSVQFRDGTNVLATVTNAPFDFNWTNALIGAHSLTAVATDNGGLSATSALVNITMQTAVPDVVMTSPVNSNSYVAPASFLVRAVVSDADLSVARVDFYQGGTLLGSVTNPPSQPTHQLTLYAVGVGTYSYYAVVHDAHGPIVTSSPPHSITVNPAFVRPSLRFAPASYSVDESAGTATLTVVKDGTGPASVSFQTVNGSALFTGGALGDYANTFGSLTFGSNVTSQTITVAVGDDLFAEPAETFSVQLTDPDSGSDLGTPSTVVVTILASDAGADTNSFLVPVQPSQINVSQLGALQVYLNGASGLGQWRFDWDSTWRGNGALATGLEAGDWSVVQRVVAGWQEPGPQSFNVPRSTTRVVTNSYTGGTAGTGTLRVFLEPIMEAGLFRWRIGNGPLRVSGEGAALPPGLHVVEFEPVPGRSTPATRLALVFEGGETEITAAYQTASAPGESVVLPQSVGSLSAMEAGFAFVPRKPYVFNGQLRTAAGFGSGFAVRGRVVLTAAHVVFDDTTLAMVPSVDFLPRRFAGEFEPRPRRARGWVVMPGYIEQRLLERTNGANPGVSSAASAALDVAAIWFDEDVLRMDGGTGGAGGYLVSDPNGTNYLESALQIMLTGYPVERPDGQPLTPGRLYKLEKELPAFARVEGDARLYESAGFLSFPGNSGGPVLVKVPVPTDTYFPAGIYLGTTGDKSRVRLLDTNVLALINTAASAANLGTNFTGGGAINLAVVGSGNFSITHFNFTVGPPAALAAGGRWRIPQLARYVNFTNAASASLTLEANTTYQLIFATNVPGWDAPTNLTLNVPAGNTTTVPFNYVLRAAPPVITAQPVPVHAVAGETVPFRVTASGAGPLIFAWQRHTNVVPGGTNATLLLPNVSPTNAGLYRVVVNNVAGSVTSTPALLTVTTQRPSLNYDFALGLTLHGPLARHLQVQTNRSPAAPGWGLWQTVLLTNSPVRIPAPSTNPPALFFRSLLEPVP